MMLYEFKKGLEESRIKEGNKKGVGKRGRLHAI